MLEAYDYLLEDESEIKVGRLRLHTIATPRHTPGSMCFRLEGSPVLFSGDTRFPGGPAPRGSQMATSTGSSAPSTAGSSPLPADTFVLPGHGADTTIGREQPHLDEWVERGW